MQTNDEARCASRGALPRQMAFLSPYLKRRRREEVLVRTAGLKTGKPFLNDASGCATEKGHGALRKHYEISALQPDAAFQQSSVPA